jgi:hypothetical protein
LAVEEFLGKDAVGCGSGTFRVILEDGFSKARSLADADGSGNRRLEDDLLEVGADIPHDGGADIGTDVEHGHEKSTHGEGRVGSGLTDLFHDADQLAEPLEGVVFALDRDEDLVGGAQGIGHQDAERWGTIQNDELEAARVAHWFQHTAELTQVSLHPCHLDLCAGKVEVGRNAGQIRKTRLLDEILHRGLADHCGIKATPLTCLEAQGAGGIPLGIQIEQEDGMARLRDGRGEVDRGCRFSDATLLVRDGDDFGLHRDQFAAPP